MIAVRENDLLVAVGATVRPGPDTARNARTSKVDFPLEPPVIMTTSNGGCQPPQRSHDNVSGLWQSILSRQLSQRAAGILEKLHLLKRGRH